MVDELTAVLDKVQLQTPPRRPPKLGDRIDDFFDNIESADAASLPPVVKEAMDSFKQQGRELIYVKPVYLGDVPAYKNYPSEIKSGAMSKKIEDDFSDMTDKDYKFHPLKDFFEKKEKGGYKPKMDKFPCGLLKMFDVDHILPESWGGPHHPRNYAVIHASMNRHFQEKLPEEKLQYILWGSGNAAMRNARNFCKDMHDSPQVKEAIKQFLKRLSE